MEFINRFALGKVDYAITDFLDAVNWYHYLDLEGNYKASKNRSFRMEYTFDEETREELKEELFKKKYQKAEQTLELRRRLRELK